MKNLKNLPTLPQILIKLIEACNNEETTHKEFSKIISKDPSLSAKIMRLVNSSYMGLNTRIKSIEQAVVYLGSDAIRNMAISASVVQVFSHVKGDSLFSLNRFWRHSVMCASIARRIAKESSYEYPEEAFLSGLLHDIGKLVLWVNFKEDYAEILKDCEENPELLIGAEMRLGTTHCEVGAWLIRQWKFNSFVADAVLYHHEPVDKILHALPLVKIVYVANILCVKYDEDRQAALKAAKAVFGFSPSHVEDIVFACRKETNDVALAFNIPIEPSVSADKSEPSEQEDNKYQKDLLCEVKNFSLLYGTVQNLLNADSMDSILKIVEQGLRILCDVTRSFFFLYEPGKDLLVGTLPEGNYYAEIINNLAIPFNNKSLLAMSLSKKIVVDSFGYLTDDVKSMVDEKIIDLLETKGMLCFPMFARKKPVGVMVIGIDDSMFHELSDRIKMLRMLANQAAMCIHVDEARRNQARIIQSERMEASSTIARQIVHEVNNPLGIIKNYIKILGLKLPENHPVRNELGIISEEVDRVGQIVKQLSFFAQPEVKKLEPVNINILLSDLLKIIKKSILDPSKINLYLRLDPSLPKIVTEKNSLKQVFINLIKNAAEAMTDGGNIYVETKPVSFSGKIFIGDKRKIPGEIEITVGDDGPGIPDNIKTRLFEPYNSSKGKGHFGIGLSIVYNIVKELNGVITFESNKDTGTIFKIVLPISASKK
ncbi:MAG: HDOD domain-containing protein [Deltaproteobacteria bacterium]|nr:HDOD domain-containing protein [Deltaproteobacteria bacterium]